MSTEHFYSALLYGDGGRDDDGDDGHLLCSRSWGITNRRQVSLHAVRQEKKNIEVVVLLMLLRVASRRSVSHQRGFLCSFRAIVSTLPWFLPSSTRGMTTTTTKAGTTIVGVAQLRASNDKVSNLLDIAKCAGWAKRQDVSMLFLPENCGFMGEAAAETLANAEPPVGEEPCNAPEITQELERTYEKAYNGESFEGGEVSVSVSTTAQDRVSLLDGLRALARKSQMWISVGAMHVSGAPPHPDTGKQRIYNTHVILDDTGTVKAIYRKIHLFDVNIPGKVKLMESNSTAAGNEIVVCDTPVGRLGLATCYDMRFPELWAELVKRGAQILLMPSAFTVPTGQAHWHVLLRARAIECQTYVIAAAQYGKHNEKRSSNGHSLVVDPWGVVLADAGGVDTEAPVEISLVTAEIDLNFIDSVRSRMPVQQHREAADWAGKR